MAAQSYVNRELELLLTPFDADDQTALQPVVELVYGFYADKAGLWPRLKILLLPEASGGSSTANDL